MTEITRRRLLGSGAIAAGGAVLASVLPPNLRNAIAATPKEGSIEDIEHVVVLMQENRSFDHYFGTLAGVRGFADPDVAIQANGKSLFYQPAPTTTNPDGYLLPWHLDTKTTSSQAIPSTSHAWSVQHESWAEGAMDDWVGAHLTANGTTDGPYTMGYYEQSDIPFQFALAENFTLCDGYHCSMLGPTWPNRMYLMSAFVDPNGEYGGPMTSNVVAPGGYTWTTYPERLEAAGVSWQVYQEEDDYGTNVLEFFKQYQAATPGTGLYERGLTISQPGQFEADAAAGTLPTVSWIIPTSGQSEHPAYLPASGADFVASKLEAVASNPELWAKTLFILNYDENDGLFDHVIPPTAPAGTPDEYIQVPTYPNWPIGGGVRVPCILVSPWTVGGWVASETFDHTSVLQLLEKVTGVVEENMSQFRRDTFGDFTSALGFTGDREQMAPALPATRRRFWEAEYEVETLPVATLPGADQAFPVQQTHRRAVSTNGNSRRATEASSATAGQAALRTTASRFTESRGSHRGDFPGDSITDGEFPGKMAELVGRSISAATHAYVSTVCGGGVMIIDTTTYTPVSALVSETNPYGIATTPDGSALYVTESGTNLVSAFTVAELQATSGPDIAGTSITVGVYPHGITVSPDGSRAYVANTGPGFGSDGSATVSVIDTATNAVIAAPTVGQSPQIIALTPDSARAFVTCLDGVHVLNAASGRAHLFSSAAPQAHGVAVSPDGRLVYVVDSLRDRLLVLDARAGQTLGAVSVGSNPWNVALTADGLSAYVTNSNDDTVSVIDTATRAVTATISVSRIPTGISSFNDEMWVAGNVSSTISVIDTTSNVVTQSIALGISQEPTTIAFA